LVVLGDEATNRGRVLIGISGLLLYWAVNSDGNQAIATGMPRKDPHPEALHQLPGKGRG
jgi:hypothetical protein